MLILINFQILGEFQYACSDFEVETENQLNKTYSCSKCSELTEKESLSQINW